MEQTALYVKMAVPTPLLLTLTSASLCVLNATLFPDILPNTKLTTLFFEVSAVIFGLYGCWSAFIYPKFQSPLRHLPTPKGGAIPLIGHPSVTFRHLFGDTFLGFIKSVPNDGLIKFPGLLNSEALLLTEPSTLGEVLVHKTYDFEKPPELRRFLRIILGDGLIIVEGDEHKFQRKHISPAFSFRNIRELYPFFWSKASDLTSRVKGQIHENPVPSREKQLEGLVEINHWANKVTMDIIGVAGMGRELNTLYKSDDELVNNYEEILEPSTEKAIFFAVSLIFPRWLMRALPWKLNKTLEATTGGLRNVCRQLVRDKKDLIRNEGEKQIETEIEGVKSKNTDILSLLIRSNNFADDMLVDQLLTFLAAGHETTSSSFTWSTYLLSKHPEVQDKLRAEIRSHLQGPNNPALDPNQDVGAILENMPYLAGVCQETLRLYPPVPNTIRVAVRDTTINNVPVPKGTKVFLSPWAINRNPKLWGLTAAQFCPERWVDADTGKANNHGGVSSNYAQLTFLHGPRSCIGEKFARSELKALVAVFVGSFKIDMQDPSEVPIPAGAITTKPKNGMHLRLTVLEDW